MLPAFFPAPSLFSTHRPTTPRNASPTCTITPPRTPVHRRPALVGFLLDILRRNTTNLSLSRLYRPVYKSDILGMPVTIISDLPAITTCYKDTETFRSAGAFPPSLPLLFGPSALFILDGPAHTAKRAPVLPAFSPQLFPLYFPTIISSARTLWTSINHHLRQNPSANLAAPMKEHYFRIILRLTTGSNTDEPTLAHLRHLFYALAAGMFTIPHIGPTWHRAQSARKALLAACTEQITARLHDHAAVIDELRAKGADRVAATAKADLRVGALDLLTVLVASSALPTVGEPDAAQLEQLAELVVLLWFAGYTTQASATLCCLMELGFDDGVRARLREEQDAIVARTGAMDVTYEQVRAEMPLLDSFVTEVLRLHPAAPIMFRKTARATVVCGHEVAEGEIVGLDTWGAQRDARYYEEPDVLKVDRFVAGEGAKTAPLPPGIVSFGAVGGAHFCLGAALARVAMKVTLSVLLREFELVLDPRQSREFCSIPEMRPRTGVDVVGCERRDLAAGVRGGVGE